MCCACLQARHKESVARFQTQLQEARQIIEELEAGKVLAIAQAKQQLHEMLEGKDQELTQVRDTMQTLTVENQQLQEKIGRLEKSGECCKIWRYMIFPLL